MDNNKQLKSILKKNNKYLKKNKKNISFSETIQYKSIPNRFNLNDISDIALSHIILNQDKNSYFCFEYFIIIFLILIFVLYCFNNNKKKYSLIL
jgi:hypothetical protein